MVQNSAVPHLLEGKDVLIKVRLNSIREVLISQAHTGSGKTLAYLVPLINKLLLFSKSGMIKREQGTRHFLRFVLILFLLPGTYGLIISPTRELCIQIYDVLHKLTNKFPWMVPGQVTGTLISFRSVC